MRITNVVEIVLRDLPETRNSDKLLMLEVWDRLGFALSATQRAKFLDMPNTETIRRVRQKLQEGGKYPAAERIRTVRRLKSQVIQQNAPKAKPERVEALLEQDQRTLPLGYVIRKKRTSWHD